MIDAMRRWWIAGRGEKLSPDISVIGYHRGEKVRGTGKPRTGCTVRPGRYAEYRTHIVEAGADTEMLSRMLEHYSRRRKEHGCSKVAQQSKLCFSFEKVEVPAVALLEERSVVTLAVDAVYSRDNCQWSSLPYHALLSRSALQC